MELRDMFAFVVVCFVVQLVQCSAMSVSELEDFSNFLKKSSQLDETLKKGPADPHDFDEDEEVSDHAWEESGKFEGDLILNDRQRRTIVQDVAEGLSRNGIRDSTKRWPDNEVIYYIQKEHFSDDQVEAIQSGIDDIGRASCIKFRPYKKGDRDAVVIQGSRRGCFSQVGYQSGYQVLNLSGRHPVGRGCFRHGTVVHEMLHTLGFYHMQSSPDRDEYVDVVWENIVQPARHNFRKYNAFAVSDFGVGYDYDSVLHYSRRAFSNNGQDTIVPKQGGAEIGQRTGLSDKDTQKLNKMYCDADSNSEAEESTTKITLIKKKAPKNKPFDGHGIGYHQGKTVIIKLLPDEKAETYHILSQPVYHIFDYFSKTPQILSTKEIEDHGVEKSLAGPYKPYAAVENITKGKSEVQDDKNLESPYNVKTEHEDTNKVDKEDENYVNTEKTQDVTSEEKKEDAMIDNTGELYEAFNRLSDILKTHVYPSQTPDFSIYKLNTAYSDFSDPNKISKIAYDFIPIYSEGKESENDKNASAEYIKSLYKDGPDSLISEKKQQNHELLEIEEANPETKRNITREEEQTLGTSYPFKINQHYSNGSLKIETPEYASYENLKDIHDYSAFYSPSTTKENTEDGRHYALFRESVPTYDDWYQRKELKQHPVDYNQELYTDNMNKLSKLTHHDGASESSEYDPENSNEYYSGSYSPIKKEDYKLFGAPVPLTKDWYKVNHQKLNENYPYKYYHPAKTSHSEEEINEDS